MKSYQLVTQQLHFYSAVLPICNICCELIAMTNKLHIFLGLALSALPMGFEGRVVYCRHLWVMEGRGASWAGIPEVNSKWKTKVSNNFQRGGCCPILTHHS